MNKSALRKFAINARKELLERVELQARKIGITKDGIEKANIESSDAVFINGKPLTDVERRQRNKLINRIEEIGFDQVMEETAYTWFNRFIALRFMEVNNYLPTKVRVLSSESEGSTEPDMMKEALSLDLPIDKEYVYELKMENKSDELFKYLIKLHCNDLNRYMPFMFETIEDYKEILFPEGLLGKDSFVQELINTEVIPEEDWQKIEIIGWLYQFYITEEKDRVFKAKKKYKPEEIPFATQLFTPDWIVQYMVQNSLGRYWVEAHPEHEDLKENWQYFIEHEEGFQEKIEPYINKELNVEEIKCFDPAMGSGHILVYMFDVLYEIYSKSGYMEREIPRLIIENNLYGLDIDDRAYQLAAFSVVMKALQYNRRFLRTIERHGLELNLASIQETNNLTEEDIAYLAGEEKGETFDDVKDFMDQFKDAKTIGSLIKLNSKDTSILESQLEEMKNSPADELFADEKRDYFIRLLPKLLKQTQIMRLSYDILVTNPPYMGSSKMNQSLTNYLKKHYPVSKSDLFASFMEVNQYLKPNSMYAIINQDVWMFKTSYRKLRNKMIHDRFIDTMLHLGPHAFEEIGGEIVQTTSFVMRNNSFSGNGIYIKLIDFNNATLKRNKFSIALQEPKVSYRYTFNQKNFSKIPGNLIAYWTSDQVAKIFAELPPLNKVAAPRKGLTTGDNDQFVRLWHEVSAEKFSIFNSSTNSKWIPMTKGGNFRRWYGNNEYVINWENNGHDLKNFVDANGKLRSVLRNPNYYFRESISWNDTASIGNIAFRYQTDDFIPNASGPCVYSEDDLLYLFGLLNSVVSNHMLKILAPNLKYEVGQMALVPIIYSEDRTLIESYVKDMIEIAKSDWDYFEESWDFTNHPFLRFGRNDYLLADSYHRWTEFTNEQFKKMHSYEEKVNQIFIDLYQLQDELISTVEDDVITLRKADKVRDMKSFISYAVGCMFGRYSLDEEGLIYAGGEFEMDRYQTYPADVDNIIPILSSVSFEDDILSRFIQFVQVTYGEDTLEDNLNFIADALGRRKNETARETIRRYFLNDFYKDHVQTYQKRPIYWLFTSGKEKAFNCLIYMHRYDKTTLSRIRTDYLHDVQARFETEKIDLLSIIESDDSTDKEVRDAKKELKSVEKKIEELKAYDEKLHHLADQQIEIDLDDGVKVNYEKFKGLVAKI